MDWEKRVVVGMVALVAVFAAWALWMAADVSQRQRRQHQADMAACQATGRAEWECRALLQGHGTTVVPMPVVVPR